MTGATESAVASVIFCYNSIYDASGADKTVKDENYVNKRLYIHNGREEIQGLD